MHETRSLLPSVLPDAAARAPSRLASPAPLGWGTGLVECATSYTERVAHAHALRSRHPCYARHPADNARRTTSRRSLRAEEEASLSLRARTQRRPGGRGELHSRAGRPHAPQTGAPDPSRLCAGTRVSKNSKTGSVLVHRVSSRVEGNVA